MDNKSQICDEVDNESISQSGVSCGNSGLENCVVSALFCDGFAFRQLIDFGVHALTCFPMFFYEDRIEMIRCNGNNTMIVVAVIKASKLIEYHFDRRHINNPERGFHYINVNLKKF